MLAKTMRMHRRQRLAVETGSKKRKNKMTLITPILTSLFGKAGAAAVSSAAGKVGTAAAAYTTSQCIKHIDDVAGFGVEVFGGLAETGLNTLNDLVDSICFPRR